MTPPPSSPMQLTVTSAFIYIFTLYLTRRFFRARSRLPYPPGPQSKVPFGNFRLLPTQLEWLEYERWGKKYNSDIVHISILGNHLVVLNSASAVEALLEKRALVTSDRPTIPMLEIAGWNFVTPLLPYGENLREHRKLHLQTFGKDQDYPFYDIQAKKVGKMLRDLLASPEKFREHCKSLPASILLSITYGRNIESEEDEFVQLIEEAISTATKFALPGASIVNIIPWLRHLPPWFPGMSFHKIGAECFQQLEHMKNVPLEFVKQNMASGKVESRCIASELLEENEARGSTKERESFIRDFSATLYAVGTDTIYAALVVFFHAMVMHPEVQVKARKELDRVIGGNRLPEYGDRHSLPYIEAIYREMMRWRPVTPLAIPHRATEDIVHDGYFIPEGTVIIGNTWALTRNRYDNPEDFIPERFLDKDGGLNEDSQVLTYGYGRRICPGRFTASTTVWLVIASVLSTFEINAPRDEAGKPIHQEVEYCSDIVSIPGPFSCTITPLSPKVAELVKEDLEV